MSLGACIPDLIAQGAVPKAKAQEALRRYERAVAELEPTMGRVAAESAATDRIVQALEREATEAERRAGLQVLAQEGWLQRRLGETPEGAFSLKAAQEELVAVDRNADVIRNTLLSGFDGFLAKHRRNLLGQVRAAGDLADVVRARFGEAVEDEGAREIAEAMGRTMDMARQRRNAAGGNTGKLDGFGFPQRHDGPLVAAAGYDAWAASGPIARANVLDENSGQWASGARREEILRAAYESIVSDGWATRGAGGGGRGSLALRRAESRTIHFADADDWMAYFEAFSGSASIYDTFVGHVSAMAREVAMMEAMGPNPAATLRFQQDWLVKSAAEAGDRAETRRAGARTDSLQQLYDTLSGRAAIPANERIALGFSVVRSIQTSAKLGSAVLSAVPDLALMMKTARFNRVPAMKMLGRYVGLWRGGEDAKLAVRLGLVTDEYLSLSTSAARYAGEELTGEVSRRLADLTLRASGLSRHTRAGQWAFGMEFLGHLAEMRGRDLGGLDPALQRQMARYGIGAADWDAFRGTAPTTERGVDWIYPTAMADRRAGERILRMVLTETDYAMIMPDLRTRAAFARFRSGTWLGEIAKSALLFKGFPVAILNLHGRRMLEQDGAWNRLTYGLTMLGGMTAAGALSVQLKQLANGKDPRPMDDVKFLGAAVAQAGAFGLLGDLAYNSTNSYGGGALQTVAGPILGQTIPNILSATVGNMAAIADGDPATDTHLGKDAVKAVRGEVPLTSLWYARAAYQRIFGDLAARWADPEAGEAYQRMLDRARKEGTRYFLAPGAIVAPDGPVDPATGEQLGYRAPTIRMPVLANAVPEREAAGTVGS